MSESDVCNNLDASRAGPMRIRRMMIAITGLCRLHADPAVFRRALRAGLIAGLVVSAGLPPLLKRRRRRPGPATGS
jgi:hypothetical protein